MIRMLGHALLGFVTGLVARAILPGRQHMGFIMTILLGVAGAWLGGLIGRVTGMYEEGRKTGFLMALLGAVILLVIYSLATRTSTAVLALPVASLP